MPCSAMGLGVPFLVIGSQALVLGTIAAGSVALVSFVASKLLRSCYEARVQDGQGESLLGKVQYVSSQIARVVGIIAGVAATLFAATAAFFVGALSTTLPFFLLGCLASATILAAGGYVTYSQGRN